MKKTLMTLALTGALSTTAMASVYGGAVTVGLTNDNVIDEEGLRIEAEVRKKQQVFGQDRDIRLGVTTLTDVSDSKLLTYGAYLGYSIPISQGQGLKLVPRVGIEHYDRESELLGFVDAGLEYNIDKTVTVDARAKYSEAFDSDVDMDGVSYMFGVTKVW